MRTIRPHSGNILICYKKYQVNGMANSNSMIHQCHCHLHLHQMNGTESWLAFLTERAGNIYTCGKKEATSLTIL